MFAIQDVKYAIRLLAKSPVFTVLTVLILGGIRRALGATDRTILRLLLGQGSRQLARRRRGGPSDHRGRRRGIRRRVPDRSGNGGRDRDRRGGGKSPPWCSRQPTCRPGGRLRWSRGRRCGGSRDLGLETQDSGLRTQDLGFRGVGDSAGPDHGGGPGLAGPQGERAYGRPPGSASSRRASTTPNGWG